MTERAKLIQLPTGAWVRLDDITSILPLPPAVGCTGQHYLARVTVWCGQSMHSFEFPGMDEARAYADDLAAKVNNA